MPNTSTIIPLDGPGPGPNPEQIGGGGVGLLTPQVNVQQAGKLVSKRGRILNFVNATVADNPEFGRADVTIGGVGTLRTFGAGFGIWGSGNGIAAGARVPIPNMPFSGKIVQATLLADQAGNIVLDVWKVPYGSYPPTIANTIVASDPPTLSSAIKMEDTLLTGWNTTVTVGDTFIVYVTSASGVNWASLELAVQL